MRRTVYFNYIIKKDNESINEIKKKKKEIHELKMDYKDKQVKIVKISQKISEQKTIYQEASEDQADYLQKVQHQKSFYEKETQALENESSRISSMLQNMAYQQKLEMQRYLAMKKEYARTGRKYASISMPRSMSYGGGRMGMPCSAGVTSYFGYRVHPIFGTRKLHTGIDFGAATGTPIYAASNGVVINAGWTGGYGKAIIIDHGGGIATLYGHTSQMYVSVGQSVKRGQLIAAIGTTGFSTGPHLHFEVRAGGSPVDPLPYLR
ncbi:MAG: M23 family metallopeptidase [Candidatus Sericytochromatia bacterium]|nr:M23 family metallopeptidase [Candidatus Sericytochromatia bacterium]